MISDFGLLAYSVVSPVILLHAGAVLCCAVPGRISSCFYFINIIDVFMNLLIQLTLNVVFDIDLHIL
jgi:hypothetical protein